MKREDVLDTARQAVVRKRSDVYGLPEQNFDRIAARWNAHLENRYGGNDYFPDVDAVDVAIMCIDIKLARLEETVDHVDSWVDIAGYAACGGEVSHAGEPKVDTPVGGIDQASNTWWQNKAFVPAETITGAMQQMFNDLKEHASAKPASTLSGSPQGARGDSPSRPIQVGDIVHHVGVDRGDVRYQKAKVLWSNDVFAESQVQLLRRLHTRLSGR